MLRHPLDTLQVIGQFAAVHQHHPQLGFMTPEVVAPKRAVSVRQSQEESINGRLSDRIGKSRCTSFFRRASALLVIPYRP